jgi:[acyl-carrier-protein] S-malonyltransferase
MNKLASLFPGQGSQYVGMAKELVTHFPYTKQLYEEASDAISENLLKLCLDGPADSLQLTFNAQPAILTTSFAWYTVLKRSLDFAPTAGAGHSLGEYSALTASGALTLSTAAKLVRRRGELMQSAVPVGKGKMAAVLGLDDAKLIKLCELASEGDDSIVQPANFNSPGQIVVSGHATAVDRMATVIANPEHAEFKPKKLIPLNVSAPFHCSLMKPVAVKFTVDLEKAPWNTPAFPVVHNLDAVSRKVKGNELVVLLRDQIDHPVQWTKCVQTLSHSGIGIFVEVGPGKVLTGLVKRTLDNPKLFAIDSLAEFQAFEKAYQEGL